MNYSFPCGVTRKQQHTMNETIDNIVDQLCQIAFPIKAEKGHNHYWYCTQEQAICWAEAYRKLDVVAEALKAKAWLISNQSNRKSPRGMGKFLNGWFSRTEPVRTFINPSKF